MEFSAILLYLADKKGELLPSSVQARWDTIQWLMWQVGGIGPMFAQAGHYRQAGQAQDAEERFSKDVHRLYGVLDKRRLSDHLST
jgi:GSH-dependent disulfide-bond oxidoreductase